MTRHFTLIRFPPCHYMMRNTTPNDGACVYSVRMTIQSTSPATVIVPQSKRPISPIFSVSHWLRPIQTLAPPPDSLEELVLCVQV